jgi:CDP-paratose 2-epimerase
METEISYSEEVRKGDHIWYVSDISKFKSHYPDWDYKYDIYKVMDEIYEQAEFIEKQDCL